MLHNTSLVAKRNLYVAYYIFSHWGIIAQHGLTRISLEASRVASANFRQSQAATTELRASTSAAASFSLISGRQATASSKTELGSPRSCPSASSESVSSISSFRSVTTDGALRLLKRKRNFLSGDQF